MTNRYVNDKNNRAGWIESRGCGGAGQDDSLRGDTKNNQKYKMRLENRTDIFIDCLFHKGEIILCCSVPGQIYKKK